MSPAGESPLNCNILWVVKKERKKEKEKTTVWAFEINKRTLDDWGFKE